MSKWRYRRVPKTWGEMIAEVDQWNHLIDDDYNDAEQSLHDLMSAGYDDVPSHKEIMDGARRRFAKARANSSFGPKYNFIREEVDE